jgi:hypothetical protein
MRHVFFDSWPLEIIAINHRPAYGSLHARRKLRGDFLMSKRRVYKSEKQAEAAKAKAVRFTNEQLGDPDRAAEIEDMSLDEWLAETGRRVENPSPEMLAIINPSEETSMPTIEELMEENENLQMALDEANSRLAQIYDLSSEEIEPEDFEDDEIELDEIDVAE